MNKKQIRPLPVKTLKKQPNKSRQKWWLIIILAALLIGYLVWKNNSPNASIAPVESTASTAASIEQDSAKQADTNSLNNTSDNSELNLDTDDATVTDNQTPDPEAILNAPLPETDSLAKEEIDRLADEHKRLAEQEKLAAEQLTMNKQLTEMKAEQIALLEEQIAQLEAAEGAKTSAK
mgnify:FL=1